MTDNLINNNPFTFDNYEFRSCDGNGNNLNNPEFDSAKSAVVNLEPLDYADGFSTPSGDDLPNTPVISNGVAAQTKEPPSDLAPSESHSSQALPGEEPGHDLTNLISALQKITFLVQQWERHFNMMS
ncbi:MAG: peroxidase family protein [Xenococcaceae cyanobacterium MO_234.B1]|nr:peroxidase family protein [Xenococcaceae cyanobacterium MO_234.B1]